MCGNGAAAGDACEVSAMASDSEVGVGAPGPWIYLESLRALPCHWYAVLCDGRCVPRKLGAVSDVSGLWMDGIVSWPGAMKSDLWPHKRDSFARIGLCEHPTPTSRLTPSIVSALPAADGPRFQAE